MALKPPVLPEFPNSPEDLRFSWNEMVRVLGLFHGRIPSTPCGTGYTIIGTIPTSVVLDLTSITVTATAQVLAKLLHNLGQCGIIEVSET